MRQQAPPGPPPGSPPKQHKARNNETPRGIAKLLGVSVDDLLFVNRHIAGIKHNSKLAASTMLLVPTAADSERARYGDRVRSGATLVVCAVSLVAQWISEAKRKLANNVQIYAYHGQNRSKNKHVLADYDIVVTTYGTVGSDKGRQQDKVPDPLRAPPPFRSLQAFYEPRAEAAKASSAGIVQVHEGSSLVRP